MPPDPPSVARLCKLHIHVTPLLKILATGLGTVLNSSHSPDNDSSDILFPQPELGSVSKLAQKPGQYIRFEGRHGELYDTSYSDTLIPVLHHGAVCGEVGKCDLCQFHLKRNCRRGSHCTYAYSWAERIRWTCPIYS